MLDLVQGVSEPGRQGRANEDGYGSSGDFAWVIDGATGLGDEALLPGRSDAAWLRDVIDGAFRSHAVEAPDPISLLRAAAHDAQARFVAERLRPPMENYEIPTAAVLLARFASDRVDIAELGDCAIYIAERCGSLARYGGVQAGRDLEKANAARLMAGRSRRDREVIAFLRGVRNRANTPGGYRVLSPDAGSAEPARCHTHRWHGGGEALLLTDGYEAAIDDYRLFDAPRLMNAARRDLAAPLAALRQVERNDPDLSAYPRFKQSDDATAAFVRYGNVHRS